ncbi:MAG: S8 family serine peptidase [Thermoanaerobaculia bacterium]|nr:S8 family serine peptidase [Thermoanaerobaculia bacterium]
MTSRSGLVKKLKPIAVYGLILALNLTPFSALALPSAGSPERGFGREGSQKIRIFDGKSARAAESLGARLVSDYGSFKIYEVSREAVAPVAASLGNGTVEFRSEENQILLNSGAIDTTLRSVKDRMGVRAIQGGKGLHLIQFAGPVKPEWHRALEATGVRIVNYIPSNAYLVYGDASQLATVSAMRSSNSFVQWDGAYEGVMKLHPNVLERQKRIANGETVVEENSFSIQLVEDPAVNAETLAFLRAAGVISNDWSYLQFRNLVADIPATVLEDLSKRPDVVSIQAYVTPRKRDERQAQIVAGNLTGSSPIAASYSTQLATWGFTQAQFNTSNFAVDITDDGLDNGTTNTNNPQFHEAGLYANATRVIYNGTQTGSTFTTPGRTGVDGHGNLNSSVVGGFVPVAFGSGAPHADAAGFRYGQGIAPFVKLAASTIFTPSFTSPNYPAMLSRGYTAGTRVSSNSWGASVFGAYNTDSQAYDGLVRDADSGTAGNQEMVIIFAAGNDGSGANTVGSPGTAKNVVTVGAAENVHSHATAAGGNNASGNDGCGTGDTGADSANDIIGFSSRGPCDDQRVKPEIVAPGTHVTGAVWQAIADPANNGFPNGTSPTFTSGGVCALPGSGAAGDPDNFFPLGQQWYTTSSGTSHSTPAVAGGSALVRQYFINQGWGTPSPAMNKAYLMNSARYMNGTGANDTLPSNNQGMGHMNLGPAFDGTARVRSDQVGAMKFTATGQSRTFTGTVQDVTKPFRVTLAWTDAPGATSGNAYNNNLDLTVTVGGNTYLGNVFTGANSVTGGTADPRNNAESVFLPAGIAAGSPYTVTVTATNIVSNGVPGDADPLDQDFALVIYNAAPALLPVVGGAGATLTGENCSPVNSAPDPSEGVTYSLCLQNVGTQDTTAATTGTLQATGGITSPSAPQNYGVLVAGGPAVCRTFTFVVDPVTVCGNQITPSLQVQDGASNLGTVAYAPIMTGAYQPTVTGFENFDTVTAPALPTSWTSTVTGPGLTAWTTSTNPLGFGVDTAPNAVFIDNPNGVSDKRLDTPTINFPAGGGQLSFRHRFAFESATASFDGAVLEIAIGATAITNGTYTDFITAGGSWVTGGYTGTISSSFSNPLAGRAAWVRVSGAYITTTANMPASANGQPIRLRWRMGSDVSVSATGWAIDSITLPGMAGFTLVCSTTCGNTAPTITPVASLTVPRGATTNAQIATVTDPDTAPPALAVSATGAPAGITVANFVLTPTTPGNYNVTADIIATCAAAASGPVNLQVTDGIAAPATGSFTLNTTANAAGATLTGGATLCAGESTTLSVALTGTGPWSLTWSDGFVQSGIAASPATRVVTPAVTTTYTITAVSGANGCAGTGTGSALVTVNPRPTATVTGGGTICAGTSGIVSVALTGTAPWTITWNDGMVQIAGASPATRTVSPTFNQAFSVVSLSDSKCAGGTSTGMAAFVVKPVPSAVITAADGVCFSSTGNVASVPDGGAGTTYAWAITGGTITAGAGTRSITFTANASGNVVLTVTVTKDGCPNVGTKTIPIQTLPSAPVPMIPSNGSTYSGAFVSWTHAGGTYYDVYLDTVNPPEKLIFSGQTNNFEAFIPSWVSGVTYYWKVVARNGCGSVPSSVQSFVAGSCPWTGAAPVLTSPANGATGVGSTATLVWTPVAGTAHYDVYLGTSSGSLTRYDVVEAPQNSVAVPVSAGATYYWKVVAVPVCGSAAVATSSTNSFTTAGTPFGATGFAPSFFNRWETGTVTLSGSGFTAGMQLFTDYQDAEAGTLVPAIFTNSFSNPTQLQATLIGNPAAPAGRYDVGVTVSGLEEGRLLQAMALRAFTDVTESDYYYLSSARMADAGIMEADFSSGTPGPQYMPNTNVPRAWMAEYLAKSYQFWRYRSTGLPSATCTPSGAGSTDFPDVACSHPNWLAIHWIKAWGVTQGSPCAQGLCFNPNNNVTRAEMVTFIERLRQTGVLNTLLSTVGETDPGCAVAYPACKGWTDAGGVMDVAGWPRREANVAFVDRITAGCSGAPGSNLKFCPNDAVTRAQIGEFLARTLGLVPMP